MVGFYGSGILIISIDVISGINVSFGWRGKMCASADFAKQHYAAIDRTAVKTNF